MAHLLFPQPQPQHHLRAIDDCLHLVQALQGQQAFLRLVQELGGVAAVCRSIEQARAVLDIGPAGGPSE